MSVTEQVDALRAEKLDLGFVRLPVLSEFETMPVIEDRVMLVTSADAKFPAQLPLRELSKHPFVLISRDRSPTFHQHVLTLCASQGLHPNVVQEVPELTTALALVRAGLGLTMIPQSFGTTRFGGVRFHSIADEAARWEVGAAWRRGDPNPLVHRFLALLATERAK